MSIISGELIDDMMSFILCYIPPLFSTIKFLLHCKKKHFCLYKAMDEYEFVKPILFCKKNGIQMI